MVNGTVESLQMELMHLRQHVAELEQQAGAHNQAGATFQESQLMLQLVMDNIPWSIFWKDRNLVYLGCNQQFAHDAGLDSPAELIGKNDFDLRWKPQAELYRAADRRVIESGCAELNFEEPQDRGDGQRAWLRTSKIPLRDSAGAIVAVLGMYEDITARKHIEQELRTFQALAENAPDAIAVAGLESRSLTYANPTFRTMLGYGDEIIGLPFTATHPEYEANRARHAFQEAVTHGTWQGMLTFQRKDGSTFPGQFSSTILRDAAGQPQAVAGIIRDMSEQIRSEEERIAMQEQVIAAQRAALRELSTPLIPLADGLVVMPLIGSMDSARAQQVMETLLEGVATRGADTAILDITGLQIVDTQVANALVRAAQAVKLLGAQVVLTGIRPEVAQTLVGMGADLSSIVTLGSLQSGIAYALGRQ